MRGSTAIGFGTSAVGGAGGEGVAQDARVSESARETTFALLFNVTTLYTVDMPNVWKFSRKPTSRDDSISLLLEDEEYREHIMRRFLALSRPGQKPSDCWTWVGSKTEQGYGRLGMFKGVEQRAHRVAYALFVGRPVGDCVCHRCDNPECANPLHLFDGSHGENIRDAVGKGRHKPHRAFGSTHARRLTEDQVREIRRTYRRYSHSAGQGALSKRFGISPSAIHLIVKRKCYASVAD